MTIDSPANEPRYADRLQSLTAKSNRHAALHLCMHGTTVLTLATLVDQRAPFWPLLMLPLGISIVFLFTLLHETSHRTAFKTVWLNRLVASLCGFIIVLPPEWFRWFHLAHHRHTQDPARDPELASPKPDSLGTYLIHVSGLPVWFDQISTIVKNAAGKNASPFVPASARRTVKLESRLMLLGYSLVVVLSVLGGSDLAIFAWGLPALIGQPFLRLYLLAEHTGCAGTRNVLDNTRTIRTHWLLRKLAWNMPFHTEHHACPGVPFHRLPELHRLMKPGPRVVTPGYLRFHLDYLAKLKT